MTALLNPHPISAHVSWAEFCDNSETAHREGIDNKPINPQHIIAAQNLAENVFEKIREHFGVPLTISSFYRCPALNKAVGGVADSQHQFGQAMDIEMGWEMNLKIMEFIRDNLDYDQVLNEHPNEQGMPAWVHVSYISPEKNRKMCCVIPNQPISQN
jgi:zinc D-Ala-D-Ala carboxypeptidase